MSESANVALVREVFRVYEGGTLEEWTALFADDVEVPALSLAGTESVYRGLDGVRRWFEEQRSGGTPLRSYPDEFIEPDEHRVVVLGRVTFEGGEGRGFGSVAGWVHTIEDGKVKRIDIYPHPRIALIAAGLEQPDEEDAGAAP